MRISDWSSDVCSSDLTDDQGWRIEIDRYPKLTSVGAWRQPAGAAGVDANGRPVRYGGFYTKAEIRDVGAYAAARHIPIVPENEKTGPARTEEAAVGKECVRTV